VKCCIHRRVIKRFVNVHVLHQRAKDPQGINMGESGLIVDEMTLRGGFEQPLAHLGLTCAYIAHVEAKGKHNILMAESGGDDVEVDEQSFIVFDDLRLTGVYA